MTVLVSQVTHSPEGMETLRQFLFDVCGTRSKSERVIETTNKIGSDLCFCVVLRIVGLQMVKNIAANL
nr:Glutamine amidotransferase [Ipomoea batatas]